jgi:GNAT superfamily N-acetyltransferase
MNIQIREIKPEDYEALGTIMVDVYSNLDGFPTPSEQPKYYKMLRNVGSLSEKPNTKVLIALSDKGKLLGGVVYFSDMAQYGSRGTATEQQNASGIRLLAVRRDTRRGGVGKALTMACIDLARKSGNKQVILHTTKSMQIAWGMYERLGFYRSEDLDFNQGELSVYGFRLNLI